MVEDVVVGKVRMKKRTRRQLVPADRTGHEVSKREAIAAAKLRVVLDQQQGYETEPWILELAKAEQ